MSYFDRYKKRLQAKGGSVAESYENASINIINQTFSNHPSFAQVDIEGLMTDVRIVSGNESDEKKLLFKPSTVKEIGQHVTIGTEKWMIMDFQKHDLTPKAEINKFNNSLKWKDGTGTIQEELCIITSTVEQELEDGKYFLHPNGTISVLAKYNSNTKSFSIDYKFILGNSVYKIVSIDDVSKIDNGIGVIIFKLEKVEKSNTDDMTNRVADNSNSSGGGWL